MCDRKVCGSEQEGRHCSRRPDVRTGQRVKRNSNGIVYGVPDFMDLNIVASFCCCCPFGWLGLIFSMMCQTAKSEGKRMQAICLSVTAGILFTLSVIGGMYVFTNTYYRYISYGSFTLNGTGTGTGEMMGFYIMLCSVHTTQGQGQEQGTIVFYCTHPRPCPGPGLVQCV